MQAQHPVSAKQWFCWHSDFPKPNCVNTTLPFEVERTLNLLKPDGIYTSLGRNVHMTLCINVGKTLNFFKPAGVITTLVSTPTRSSRRANRMARMRDYACTRSGSRYITFLLTSRRSVVCPPSGFPYTTLREPDGVLTTLHTKLYSP